MIAAAPPDFAFWTLVLGAVVFSVLKGMERFGWLRTPTQWKTECEALQRECDRLNIRIVVLEKEVVDLRGVNAQLQARPDMSELGVAMAELSEQLRTHDTREGENHKATLAALNAITDRLLAIIIHPEGAA